MSEQRRLVAVLFADLVGSTTLSDGLDPEDTRALMATYYQHALAVAQAYNGTLEKFIGDAVLMLFGTPRARRDDAERSLRAALELRRAVSEDPLLPGFRLRLGVHLGEVVTSTTPTDVFIASGDAMNVAARLEQNAEAEQILVSSRIADIAAEAFEFSEEKELNVAGKNESLLVRELLGERSNRHVIGIPLVGREYEMAVLREGLKGAHPAKIVMITGAPGLGRTKLLDALITEKRNAGSVVLKAEARGQQARAAEISWSLAQSLCQTEPTLQKLQSILEEFDMDASESLSIASSIAASAGLSKATDLPSLDIIVRAWSALLKGLSARSDVMIAIDDIHLLSEDSWGLLTGIYRANLGGVKFCLTSRSDLLIDSPLPNDEISTIISLEPLSEEACHAIVQQFSSRLSGSDHLVKVADGNPLFLVELIKLAIRSNGSRNSFAQEWPDSIRSLITEQVDELTPVARDILLMLAVAGSALPIRYIDQEVGELARENLNILVQTGLVRTINGRVEVSQTIVAEIVYASISRADRVRRHVDLGLSMGRTDKADIDIAVAGEQLRLATVLASQAAIPQRVPVPAEQATNILRRAADAAWSRGAATEARQLVDAGIAMSATVEHKAMFLELRGDGLGWSPEAVKDFEDLADLVLTHSDSSMELLAAALRGHRKALVVLARGDQVTWMGRDPKTLTAHLFPALALAKKLGDEKERALLLLSTHFFPPQIALNSDILQERLEISKVSYLNKIRQHLNATEHSLALDALRHVAEAEGRLEDVVDLAAMRLEDMASLPVPEQVDALTMYQMALWLRGRFVEAIDVASLIPRDPTRSSLVVARILSYSATFAYRQGLWDKLDAQAPGLLLALEEAISNDQDTGDVINGYFALLWGALARKRGDDIALYRECLDRCLKADSPWTEVLQRVIEYGLGETENIDFTRYDLGNSALTVVTLYLERGIPVPEKILAQTANREVKKVDQIVIQAAMALDQKNPEGLDQFAVELAENGMSLLSRRIRRVAAEIRAEPVSLAKARRDLTLAGDIYFAELDISAP